MTERVRLAGGTLSLVTELNKGTELRARIPVGAPARRDVGGQAHLPVVQNRASDPESEPVQSS
jgi:hypothetical protein